MLSDLHKDQNSTRLNLQRERNCVLCLVALDKKRINALISSIEFNKIVLCLTHNTQAMYSLSEILCTQSCVSFSLWY